MNEAELRELILKIIAEETEPTIPIGVSNHHIHLTQSDFDILFPGQEMTVRVPLKQPGEFASNQTVTIVGPRGEINNVRILGPCRAHSQVELAKTEARQIGVNVPIRMSGDLQGTPTVTVKTKDGQVEIQGAIAAKRHIHMSDKDAEMFGVQKGDIVKVSIETEERKTIFDDVVVRPDPKFVLEMHIDTDEANAANVGKGTVAKLIKD
ncbi:phosphate propanoyltransferase [Vagococcus carniphilus]|uniref:Phosphate propanoyltransferase n=1 Tax=Vagococcus carniphilus TaxID=218144 RepID=A0AAW8U9J2_9ENTE|nr:phosphate propanoyltransferase [Vagococcus carniphilus]MDT2815551.1 phosphate propanoyltransferase [Vagococcus carniphilus]MDT2830815.1 phosphate propanoyltransferase [Vagococcus carniphilus]MDT2834492.1 phosphate propanoyltransferase [Vagococcus carniphilus]MDT2839413.1 phosphate propanoyltransferase [Vagococcus carniphilus]MDT2848568.1 phosphate propanoyltransferase [Vagococcus carniphilus]